MYFIALIHFCCIPVKAGTLSASYDVIHIPDSNAMLTGKFQLVFYNQRYTWIDNSASSPVSDICSRRSCHEKMNIRTRCLQHIYQMAHSLCMLRCIITTCVCLIGPE